MGKEPALGQKVWRILGTLWMVTLAGTAARAQQEAVPGNVFGESIDVRVVNVEAVVTDGQEKRVKGLSAADFRLLVDGREVPIEFFTEVEDGKAAPVQGAPAGPQAPVAAGEAVGRSYLVYIDDSFSLANARDAALEKIARDLPLLKPGDQMAVLAFDGARLDILSGWTRDAAALSAALRRARARPATGGQQLAYQRALQADVNMVYENDIGGDGDTNPLTQTVGRIMESLGPRVSPEARTQLGKTATAAAGALRGFEAPAGRKVILMLSGAWTMKVAPQLYGPMVEAANRLGYTIYPVDVAQSDARSVSALGDLAGRTGGRILVSAKMDAFREVVADTGSYYWLGFTPSWKADDRAHRVVVEPRSKDLKVRSRGGFSDLSKRTETAIKAESVLLFGGSERERRLIIQLGEPKRVGRGELEIPVTLGVPVESLALSPKGEGYVAQTPLAIVAMDEKGGRADLPASHLEVTMKAPPKAGTYARFQTAVQVRDLGQRLVFSVQDPVDGKAIWGSADYKPRGKP